MIYFSKRNWYSWKYDDGPLWARSTSPDEKLIPVYKVTSEPIGTLWEEAVKAARDTVYNYPNLTPSLFLSGGLDSELMLKAFLEVRAKPKVYIVRYEDDINLYDFCYAVTIANNLGVDYKIIDINLKKFYENQAEQIADDAQCDTPRMLPSMTFADYVDGLPILSMGDMYWEREHGDYSVKAQWKAIELESDFACDRYNILHNRTCIHLWARWTPGLMLAHTKWKWFHRLINDQIDGKLGNSSSKIEGWREEFPHILSRKKVHGFESIDPLINEFESFLKSKYNGLPYRRRYEMTLDELWTSITGKGYER